jgi:lipooligosaccharide transport system ATP-binding protein
MDYGKILVEGEPAALVKEYIGEEVVEVEKTDAVIACLREMDIPFETLNDTIEITHDGVQDIGRTLYDRCRPRKISTRPATLEDVFLKLAGRELREGA